jgi:hypothetical protein
MKVYLAANFGRREELQGYAAELAAHGITVTSRWLDRAVNHRRDELIEESATIENHEITQWALEDIGDIAVANVFVQFTGSGRRGGRHVEFGIALVLARRGKAAALRLSLDMLLVGPRENAFHHLPGVMAFPDWPACKAALLEMKEIPCTSPQ